MGILSNFVKATPCGYPWMSLQVVQQPRGRLETIGELCGMSWTVEGQRWEWEVGYDHKLDLSCQIWFTLGFWERDRVAKNIKAKLLHWYGYHYTAQYRKELQRIQDICKTHSVKHDIWGILLWKNRTNMSLCHICVTCALMKLLPNLCY